VGNWPANPQTRMVDSKTHWTLSAHPVMTTWPKMTKIDQFLQNFHIFGQFFTF